MTVGGRPQVDAKFLQFFSIFRVFLGPKYVELIKLSPHLCSFNPFCLIAEAELEKK